MSDNNEEPRRLKLPGKKSFTVVQTVASDAPTILPEIDGETYETQARAVKGEGTSEPPAPAPTPVQRAQPPRPAARAPAKKILEKPFKEYGDVYDSRPIAVRLPVIVETALRRHAGESRVPVTRIIDKAIYDYLKRNGILPETPAT